MKVLITHSWSEDNSGDYAIENAIYKLLKDHFKNQFDSFVFYSLFDTSDSRFFDHSNNKINLQNTKVIGSLWGTPPINYSTFLKFLYIIKSFINAIFIIVTLLLQYNLFNRIYLFKKSLKYFIECEIYLVKGGTFIYAPKGVSGFVFVFRIILPIIIGLILRKKIIIAPHSFGPFKNKLATKIILFILKRVDVIFCREYVSLRLLQNEGFINVFYCPDMAFYHFDENLIKRTDTENHEFHIAITARPLDFIKESNKNVIYENYIQQLSLLINTLIDCNKKKYHIHLVSQVIGPDPREDDYEALKKIYSNIYNKNKDNVILYNRKRRLPEELISMYSTMDLIIGTRMHSVIFGFLSGTPAIAVSYLGPKHIGIMEEFGLSDFVFDIYTIKSEHIIQMIKKIEDNKLLKEHIYTKSRSLRETIINTFKSKIN